jgi:hypothetical protein
MGKTINTNIKHIFLDENFQGSRDITSEVKENPIVILNNVLGKDYYGVFDQYFVDQEKYTPICISVHWQLGGGGEQSVFEKISFFLTNPDSGLFLPTIVVNEVLIPLAKLGAIKIVLGLICRLKENHRTKRPRVAFYSKKGNLTNYEFPSYASIKDIRNGLLDVPRVARRSKKREYYVRDLRKNIWVKER